MSTVQEEIVFKPYPIPYPPVLIVEPLIEEQAITSKQADAMDIDHIIESEEISIPISLPATPISKPIRKFVTPLKPFKSPQFINNNRNLNNLNSSSISSALNLNRTPLNLSVPNLFSSPSSSPLINRTSSKHSLEVDSTPIKKKQFKSFNSPSRISTTPTSNNNSSDTRKISQSPSIELTTLERRLVLLKQARKYQKAEEEGGKDSERTLKDLGNKWKEVGKAAIELLWEHVDLTDSNSLNSFSNSSNKNNSFSTSWGFSSPTSSQSNQNSNISNSWGWSTDSFSSNQYQPPTVTSSTSEFLDLIDEEAERIGSTRALILDEIGEGDDKSLPSLDNVFKKIGSTKRNKKAREVMKEEDEEDEEEDELMNELEKYSNEVMLAKTHEVEVEREDNEMDIEKELTAENIEAGEGEENKMNMGHFMKSIGVNPNLFGWDDEEGDYIS